MPITNTSYTVFETKRGHLVMLKSVWYFIIKLLLFQSILQSRQYFHRKMCKNSVFSMPCVSTYKGWRVLGIEMCLSRLICTWEEDDGIHWHLVDLSDLHETVGSPDAGTHAH